jgi:hypothetical protein
MKINLLDDDDDDVAEKVSGGKQNQSTQSHRV